MANIIQKFMACKTRWDFGRMDKRRDAGQSIPDDVMRFENILYGPDKKFQKWQYLDVYRPAGKSQKEKLPVIVSVHGGAWVYGDKDVYQWYCMRLAQRGFAVINFSYRLAPETAFPCSVEDTELVFQWLGNNADEYGFDINNVFAVGDSAGAHLLALYASAITNDEYAKNFTFIKSKPFSLRGVALNCGKYNLDPSLEKNPFMKMLVEALLQSKITKEGLELLNASAHVTKAFPPAFVMTCIGDFQFIQAPFITKALEQAGVQFEYHCYGSEEKPLWHVFHCDPHLEEAVVCNDDECEFFRKLIK
ncbi:MAG: alpha/beta hydrolase [Treponema sp.]|nr:alpha/beta hydrolase [Treponema sp.]